MVLKPQELEQKLRMDNRDESKQIEQKIDGFLEDHLKQQGNFNLDVDIANSLFSNYSQFTLDRVLDKYRIAGWSVTSNYDQRDGNYISFKPAKTYSSSLGAQIAAVESSSNGPYS